MYMATTEEMPQRNSRRWRTMWAMPIAVSIAALAIAYILAPYFWISESGELNFWYYPMMVTAPVVYLLSAFVHSMINARKTKSRDRKRLYHLIGIYPLGVLGFGLFQTFALNAPLFCFGVTTMMVFFYIQNMQTMISVDALTRLNNRGQIDRYMDQVRFRENFRMHIMMIDIDRFKQINDTYGHGEGDRALVLVADSLKQLGGRVKCPIFLGRYGGDEFVIFVQNPGENEMPEQIAEMIRGILADKQKENRLPYELQISVGYDELRDKNDSMDACLARADEKLYEDKRSKGSLRDMR